MQRAEQRGEFSEPVFFPPRDERRGTNSGLTRPPFFVSASASGASISGRGGPLGRAGVPVAVAAAAAAAATAAANAGNASHLGGARGGRNPTAASISAGAGAAGSGAGAGSGSNEGAAGVRAGDKRRMMMMSKLAHVQGTEARIQSATGCKCHLKRCQRCKSCIKRHCRCPVPLTREEVLSFSSKVKGESAYDESSF